MPGPFDASFNTSSLEVLVDESGPADASPLPQRKFMSSSEVASVSSLVSALTLDTALDQSFSTVNNIKRFGGGGSAGAADDLGMGKPTRRGSNLSRYPVSPKESPRKRDTRKSLDADALLSDVLEIRSGSRRISSGSDLTSSSGRLSKGNYSSITLDGSLNDDSLFLNNNSARKFRSRLTPTLEATQIDEDGHLVNGHRSTLSIDDPTLVMGTNVSPLDAKQGSEDTRFEHPLSNM